MKFSAHNFLLNQVKTTNMIIENSCQKDGVSEGLAKFSVATANGRRDGPIKEKRGLVIRESNRYKRIALLQTGVNNSIC